MWHFIIIPHLQGIFRHIANQSLSVDVFSALLMQIPTATSPREPQPSPQLVASSGCFRNSWKIGLRIARFFVYHAVHFPNRIQIADPIKIVYIVNVSRKTETGQNIKSGGSV